jgi:hypothetical protein
MISCVHDGATRLEADGRVQLAAGRDLVAVGRIAEPERVAERHGPSGPAEDLGEMAPSDVPDR